MGKTAYLSDEIFLYHDTGWGHPECPERLMSINKAVTSSPYYKDLLLVKPTPAALKHIEKIHSKNYIMRVKKEIESGIQYLDSMDTVVCRKSYDVALNAVGGSLNVCDVVMKGKADHGFCSIRPPGHHAEFDTAAGFCIFNTIAIAAKYIQSTYKIKKIAIIDWDVHHGNGTQHSFESDNSIFYISTHQFPHYPGTGSKLEKGKGKGKGYTLNIPMSAGQNNDDYIQAFEKTIVPALDKFAPEIILVSAGFDAHRADNLSSIHLTTASYGTLTKILLGVADRHSKSRLICFLEGGYNLNALANSVDLVIKTLVEHEV